MAHQENGPAHYAPIKSGKVVKVMLANYRKRKSCAPRRQSRRLELEPLEDRTVLGGNPPFAVGGDPSVNPADFRVTTFASGLNYPHGMTTLSDGSLLVAVNNPLSGGSSFYNSSGELLRFVDANGDGVADGAGQVLFNNLPGGVTAVHQAGELHPGHQQPDGQRANLVPPHRCDAWRLAHAGGQHQLLVPRRLGAHQLTRRSFVRRPGSPGTST